ncbi:hypothetical protein CEK29_04600 [Bordetella genomosp. 5]|uniref:hypothetical protein n=1 Tax=Bordetella genomosp. 5 TaxID=1395608 RepID=UPI000B9E4FCA|nr:hypothetical protein [Bordetella genomosp. 5]OZI46173.1 hypothetical protein CEK29_04600 [Bordetella genomosp. 5]
MARVFKRREFARWHARERLPDHARRALQFAGQVYLGHEVAALDAALETGVLLEIRCEQDH